jgi:SHS family lactate transporter-like MFS transporter
MILPIRENAAGPHRRAGNYGIALAAVAGTVAIVIAVLTAVGTEAKGIVFTKAKAALA